MRPGFIVMSLLVLAACSFAPFPVQVNLLEAGLEEGTGNFRVDLPAARIDLATDIKGKFGPFSSPLANVEISLPEALSIPDAQGYSIDFRETKLDEILKAAKLSYTLELGKAGPIDAKLSLQAYLAPADNTPITIDKHLLGEKRFIELKGTTLLEDSITLNNEQIQAINEGQLRLGIVINNVNLHFQEAGEAEFSYNLKTVQLEATEVVLNLSETLPDEEGWLYEFQNQDLPGFGRLTSLGLDYKVELEANNSLSGVVEAQLYLASDNDEILFQEKYLFGKTQRLDLNQNRLILADQSSLNPEQMKVLQSQILRLGLRVTGQPSVLLGEPLKVNYAFSKLILYGGFSLN